MEELYFIEEHVYFGNNTTLEQTSSCQFKEP